jgi:hypothetical protein
LLPANWDLADHSLPVALETALAVTLHPDQIARPFLRQINTVRVIGNKPSVTLAAFANALGETMPRMPLASDSRTRPLARLRNTDRHESGSLRYSPLHRGNSKSDVFGGAAYTKPCNASCRPSRKRLMKNHRRKVARLTR